MMKNPKSPNQNRNQPTNPKCKNDIKPCKKKLQRDKDALIMEEWRKGRGQWKCPIA